MGEREDSRMRSGSRRKVLDREEVDSERRKRRD